ncbi:pentatricopeptide repeat-containing protein At3g12770 [Ipomoea triloba]|uniref:pentatricopeptide repeat-containing protein At3g12770 n=1 Tax=Ipomoea triloba TaxID=35885 RepID=UPI00125CF959|nr:pentatricopeptide repeat-containing protein At3g12770 [Ipomoea triloba]
MALNLSFRRSLPTLHILPFSFLHSIIPFEFSATFLNLRISFSSLGCNSDTLYHYYSFTGPESYYTSFLQNSKHKCHLSQIHAQLYVAGLHHNGFIFTKFIHVCSNLGEIGYARQLFDAFPEPYVFLWNAIIKGYARHDLYSEAIETYRKMQHVFERPDCFTLPYILKACGDLPAFQVGRAVHGQVYRLGFESAVFVQNSVVAFYTKCGNVGRARVLFDRMHDRNIVSWTSVISGYAQNGQPFDALKIFSEMRGLNVEPDWVVLVNVLKAYADVDDLEGGKCVHSLVIKMGLEFEQDLRVALTAMYSKCGQVMVANSLFNELEDRDVILWNAMISGFAKQGHANDAVELFHQMIAKNIKPDSVTIQSTILACAEVRSLDQARWVDDYVISSEYQNDVVVNTALINMYAKCGCVDLARKVFDRTANKDVVLWSAMIVAYGSHGQGREAINLFYAMKQAKVSPNGVTFLGLLMACNHSGLVQEGWEFLHSMRDYGIEPCHQHYACVVDLLGRAGYLEMANDFIMRMPIEPSISVWGALLSACKIHRHVTLGEYAAKRLFALDPLNRGHYVQLSNLYASVHMWDGVGKVRMLMKEKGLIKDQGCSMIEINGKLNSFCMGDKSHPKSMEI